MTTVGPIEDPDRYELLEVTSSGGEGQVCRGVIDIDGARIPVAVKIIHPSRLADIAEWRTRWQRQAELLRSLDHPGLVKVREVFEGPLPHERGAADRSTNTLYLVMNWVEGPTLEEWVSRHPQRDLLDSARVIGKLASAVDYLHSGSVTGNPVLHRDIKPANVILSTNGPVLVDFGFTRVLSNQSMTMVGTPAYVPPEVVASGEHSTASDRYCLGATAYFVITGNLPTPTNRPAMVQALISAAGAEGRVDIAEHVLSMMDPNPARRPSASIAWAQQLGAAAVSDAGPTAFGPNASAPAGFAPPSTVSGQLPPPPPGAFAPSGAGASSVSTTFGSPAATTVISGPGHPPMQPPPGIGVTPPSPERRGRLLVGVGVLVALLAAGLAYVALAGGADDDADVAGGTVAPSATTPPTADTTPPGTEVPVTTAADPVTTVPETTAAPTTTVEVFDMPRVQNNTVEAATANLQERGLSVEVREEEGPGPYGKVKETEPAAGEEVVAGDTVVLVVPVQPTAMIDLSGKTWNEAVNLLRAYEIEYTEIDVLGPEVTPVERILDQAPKPGEPWPTSATITVERKPVIRYLDELERVDSYVDAFDRAQAQVNGQVFTRCVQVNAFGNSANFIEYDLARGYRLLRGAFGMRDDVPSGTVHRIEVLLDGAKVWEADVALGQLVPFEIDVTGALRLRIQITDIDEVNANQWAVLTDPRLLGLEGEVPQLPED